MPRSPHAAKTLRKQLITKLRRVPDSKAGHGTMTPIDEPDGLGVHRTFEFDPTASKILAAVLPAIEDNRIDSFEVKGTGKNAKMQVTFVAGPRADLGGLFPLDAVDDIEDDEPTD